MLPAFFKFNVAAVHQFTAAFCYAAFRFVRRGTEAEVLTAHDAFVWQRKFYKWLDETLK